MVCERNKDKIEQSVGGKGAFIKQGQNRAKRALSIHPKCPITQQYERLPQVLDTTSQHAAAQSQQRTQKYSAHRHPCFCVLDPTEQMFVCVSSERMFVSFGCHWTCWKKNCESEHGGDFSLPVRVREFYPGKNGRTKHMWQYFLHTFSSSFWPRVLTDMGENGDASCVLRSVETDFPCPCARTRTGSGAIALHNLRHSFRPNS